MCLPWFLPAERDNWVGLLFRCAERFTFDRMVQQLFVVVSLDDGRETVQFWDGAFKSRSGLVVAFVAALLFVF